MSAKQSRQASLLGSALNRLTSTSPTQLPAIIEHVSSTLVDCKQLLSSEEQTAKKGPDGAAVQKLMTLVTAMVNDKTIQKRWCAVVLIKTVVDVGGGPVLRSSSAWISGLIAILKRNDPAITRTLAVITLTRIFLLTQEHPSLIRELTTPSLPQFIIHSLNNAFPSGQNKRKPPMSLLISILEAFIELLPRHPSIFRSHVSKLRAGLRPLLIPSSGSTVALTNSAQSLYALLPTTVPRDGSSEEWNKTLVQIVTYAHQSLDQILRGVVEAWKSDTGYQGSELTINSFAQEPACRDPECGDLPAWSGIHAGCEHVRGVISLLQACIESHTPAPVSVPIGQVADLIRRLCDVTAPSMKPTHMTREAVPREEREALYSHLPLIHTATLTLVDALCERFDKLLLPLCSSFLEQLNYVFKHEYVNEGVREHSYLTAARIIDISGLGFSRSQAKSLTRLMNRCCEDIVPAKSKPESNMSTGSILPPTKSKAQSTVATSRSALQSAASKLLIAFLSKIPAHKIAVSVRTIADRTAILSQDSRVMLASVLNPPSNAPGSERTPSSILPFLAQMHPELLEVEGVLRPRMPIIPVTSGASARATDGTDAPTKGDPAQDAASEPPSSDEDMEHDAVAASNASGPAHTTHGATGFASPFAPAPRMHPSQPPPPSLKRNLSPDHPPQRKRARNAGKSPAQPARAVDSDPAPRGTAGSESVAPEPVRSATPRAAGTQPDASAASGDVAVQAPPPRRAAAADETRAEYLRGRVEGDEGAEEEHETRPPGADQPPVTPAPHPLTTTEKPQRGLEAVEDDDDSDFGGELPDLHFASSDEGENDDQD